MEAGYPSLLLEEWITNNQLKPFSEQGGKRHFYTKDVFKLTVYHVLNQNNMKHDDKVVD